MMVFTKPTLSTARIPRRLSGSTASPVRTGDSTAGSGVKRSPTARSGVSDFLAAFVFCSCASIRRPRAGDNDTLVYERDEPVETAGEACGWGRGLA